MKMKIDSVGRPGSSVVRILVSPQEALMMLGAVAFKMGGPAVLTQADLDAIDGKELQVLRDDERGVLHISVVGNELAN